MIVDIKELFDAPGTIIPLEGEINLSGVDIWGEKIFSSPVQISGVFQNRSGIVKRYLQSNLRKQSRRYASYTSRK